MNWMLSEISRPLFSSCVPLARFGMEHKKKHTIHRKFDHIALSLIWGEEMEVRLENQYGCEVFSEPVCVIALPGDNRKMIPLRPFEELYLVYRSEDLPRILPGLPENRADFRRSIPARDIPLFFHLRDSVETLANQEQTESTITQLDLLGSLLLAATFRHPAPPISREEKLMVRFRQFIYQHYRETIDWEAMAAEHGIGLQTFRKIWRRKSACSPHQLVLQLRNRDACDLLGDLSLSIQEIAGMLGCPDSCYFSRFFRRMNGISPSEYRDRNRGIDTPASSRTPDRPETDRNK